MLRHTFASHLAMRGVPLKAIQEPLGHSTMEMTMRYAHLSPSIHRDAVERLVAAAVKTTVSSSDTLYRPPRSFCPIAGG